MTTTPTAEPAVIIAGDTLKWRRSDLSDYPAPTWTLSYALRGPAKIDITASADGTAFIVTVAASTTANYTAGDYSWAAYVTNSATGERYQVASGRLTISPNLSAITTDHDGRSFAKKMLDAIEAVLQSRASADILQFEVNGKKLVHMTPEQLIILRDKFRLEYANERKAERIRKGRSAGNRILVRFK